MIRYKKNPVLKNNICVNGTYFDDQTVVMGSQWEAWTKQVFPNKPPVLVKLSDKQVAKPVQAKKELPVSAAPKVPEVKIATMVSKKEEAKPTVVIGDELDLTDINGVGPNRADTLKEAGFKTVDDIAKADAGEITKVLKEAGAKISSASAKSMISSAKELVGID